MFAPRCLAHERLAIVGVSSGAQPIRNKESSLFLSVNGEIYNYLSIKEELVASNPEFASQFVSDSDCEPIMYLYKKYGPDFMDKCEINGMYAFVLYDNVSDTYVVARDPIGIIPLYMGYGKVKTKCRQVMTKITFHLLRMVQFGSAPSSRPCKSTVITLNVSRQVATKSESRSIAVSNPKWFLFTKRRGSPNPNMFQTSPTTLSNFASS